MERQLVETPDDLMAAADGHQVWPHVLCVCVCVCARASLAIDSACGCWGEGSLRVPSFDAVEASRECASQRPDETASMAVVTSSRDCQSPNRLFLLVAELESLYTESSRLAGDGAEKRAIVRRKGLRSTPHCSIEQHV